MLVKLLLLLLLAIPALAGTEVYLVNRAEHFPQDRYATSFSPLEYKLFIDTGHKDINEDGVGGQPFRLTTYELNFDGKYALWAVTAKDDEEKASVKSMRTKNYTVLISSFDVVEVDGGPRGKRSEMVTETLAELPTDFYKVEVSTI